MRVAALTLLLGLGCGSREVVLEPPPIAAARSEILALDRDGDLSLFAFSRDAPFAFRFSGDAPFSVESLLYDQPLAELGLEPGELERIDGASRGIPEAAHVFREDFDPEDPASRWQAVEGPSDAVAHFRIAGSCARVGDELEPYAAEPTAITAADDLLDGGEVHIRRVEIVDDARVLALTDDHLHLIRRGERHAPGPTTRFGNRQKLRSFAFDRARGQVWVVGGTSLSLLLLDDGGLTFVSTSTGCAGPLDINETIALDDEGRPFILTDSAAACRYDGNRYTPITGFPLLIGSSVLSMVRTADPMHPFLAGSAGRFHIYDPATNIWLRTDATPDLSPPFLPYALASAVVEGTLENWAGGSGGGLLRQPELGGWVPFPLELPPDFAPCGSGRYPEIESSESIRALLPLGDRIPPHQRALCGGRRDRSERSVLARGGGARWNPRRHLRHPRRARLAPGGGRDARAPLPDPGRDPVEAASVISADRSGRPRRSAR